MNETRIGELRKARGWTQERLADKSGVAVRTIQRLESGQDASLETISLIANALEVPVKDLFVSVEKHDFATSVEQLDSRQTAQQERRAAMTQGFHSLSRVLGILVTLAALTLAFTRTVSWPIAWLIVVVCWAAGRYLLRFLFRLVVDPWLDTKYPLSTPVRWLSWGWVRRLADGR